ncbi:MULTISPECIES: PH domain-containing protein [Acidiphilium]|uniref:Membrane-flanked domain protein n=2 Tax=Acidiphilium TaxID=522 RepID=A5FW21_ACICJ|nr:MULTISPECIES: PH domain-containing protein [Acidiphilium]MBU6356428.1 PH domain-containing protein [Rhodospirillales bacterium]ABQ29803.1 membrane-flanked domain protein [Acidiphilium cryptum JF-5]KDM65495.1 hypothetical protein ACIDI_102c00050 [Acidiphilium sp. JA12-A1]MBS3025112.1 PH domain-containing protein [Acidiphilium multivorum]MDE2327339.1 PH domain-containing protein [Rhodospirillales bacterium]
MSYIEQVLLPDETVMSWTHLHWFVYLRGIVTMVLAFALIIAGGLAGGRPSTYLHVAAAAAFLLGCWLLLVAWLRRMSTELAVTDRRVIHKSGILGRTTHEMSLEKVESVEVRQSIAGRLFNYGTVIVRGTGSTWEPFPRIADPLAFRSSITAA